MCVAVVPPLLGTRLSTTRISIHGERNRMSARPLALRLARRALSRRVLLVCIASLTSAFALLDSPLRAQAQVEEGGLQGFTPLDVARLRFATSVAIDPTGRSIAYTLYVPREPGKEPSGPGRSELWV